MYNTNAFSKVRFSYNYIYYLYKLFARKRASYRSESGEVFF